MRTAFLLALSGLIAAFLVQFVAKSSEHTGYKKGYEVGYKDGQAAEPPLSSCFSWWFGGKTGKDRVNELKYFCEGLK
jgi:hypothetical protein